jgi:hypothetical protein
MDYARIEFLLEPSDELEVVVQVASIDASEEKQQLIQEAIYGFLDVVMMAEPYPVKKMRITVVGAEFDPVSSNLMAFRLAGRDAAKKLLDEMQAEPYRL